MDTASKKRDSCIKMDKQLSLIILTYNSEKDIFDCLASVYQYNDIGEALEIIVVDNNSKDWSATEKQIKERFPDVITISNPTNGGYGQGNNVGIRASSAPIVSIMNPDVRLIMPVFGAFLKTLSAPDVVMCGGKQYSTLNDANPSFYYDFSQIGFLQSVGRSIAHKLDIYDYKRMWLQGAFFAIKKKYFESIGLFDENVFMYAEEFDIHLRLRQYYPHMRMVYLPNRKYLHLTQNRPFDENSFRRQIQSDIYVCKKHSISPKKLLFYLKNCYRYGRLMAILLRRNTIRHRQIYSKSMSILNSFQSHA